jgi:pilus assembly protein CpaF
MKTNGKQNDAWSLVGYYLEPIKHLFAMDGITEICVNRFDEIFIERSGEMMKVSDAAFADETQVSTLVNQIANALGQAVDKDTHPVLDARLADGTRVCAVLYPVATKGTCITFRIFPKEKITAEFLIEKGSLTTEMINFLKMAVLCRCNILVSGGTGSGKTTLLNVILGFIDGKDRVLSVEDTRELQIETENHIPLEAPTRRKKKDYQQIDLAFLIKTSLRKNPTRIIVGEIRDSKAAVAFLHAINTGHSACTTIHANGPEDALSRIQTLVAGKGDIPFEVVKAQVRANINLIVHIENTPNHGRRIVSIAEMQNTSLVELWRWSYSQAAHIKEDPTSDVFKRLNKYGIQIPN